MKKNQRRQKKAPPPRRRRGSFRKYTLYYIAALLLVLSVGGTLCLTVLFPIAQIRVEGDSPYATEELIASCEIHEGENLLRADTKAAEALLLEQYPYLETVRVRRSLPDTVTIIVEKATETAALRKADGKFAIVSRAGRILQTDTALCPEGLVPTDGFATEGLVPGKMLTYPQEEAQKAAEKEKNAEAKATADLALKEQEEKFSILLQIEDALSENGLLSKTRVIDVSDPLDLKFLYDGRLAVRLGSSLDLAYKIKFAKATIDDAVTSETVGQLDVSDKPTARLREYDIYTEENWMFSPDLRKEYERRIVKQTPVLDTNSEEAAGEGTPAESTDDVDFAPAGLPAEEEISPAPDEAEFPSESG